ncbi:glycoside hydrolase family 5 protein [Compostibacter hankyongensis]
MQILRLLIFCCAAALLNLPVSAQSPAWKRAGAMGMGINLSWLENYWNGTPEKDYRDYLDMGSIAGKKQDLALMRQLGFTTVRLPVSFDHWTSRKAPYVIEERRYFAAIDSILSWAGEYGLKVIIDDHHGALDDSARVMQELPRLEAIWRQVATRYKDTDPERVFFELYNEPHQISSEAWKTCALQLLKTVRDIAPHHTLIIGGESWNSIDGLLKMGVLPDDNIIYTFHFYDPFLFTHQGASWAGKKETANTGIPFPYDASAMPPLNPLSKGTWGEHNYNAYSVEGQAASLRKKLEAAKAFSDKFKVPVFCGEWGSYKKYPDPASRVRYMATIKGLLEALHIPFAYWEWDQSFSFFDGEPSLKNIPAPVRKTWGFRIGG